MKSIGQKRWIFNIYTLLLRLVLAIVIFPYGTQKLFGWFGSSYDVLADRFIQWFGLSSSVGTLIAWGIVIAVILLVLGFFTRIAGLAIAVLAVVAMLVPGQNGSLMNWYSTQLGEGIEFFLLLATIAAVLFMTGAGGIRIGALFKNPFSSTSKTATPKPKQPAMAA